ncbi:hypothetical protein BC833DRAFT_574631 [Globomyces pollinis-pini]|nr:hypothetical protein BC833DRAFT_574631 [Globomyces pollinis-pini]
MRIFPWNRPFFKTESLTTLTDDALTLDQQPPVAIESWSSLPRPTTSYKTPTTKMKYPSKPPLLRQISSRQIQKLTVVIPSVDQIEISQSHLASATTEKVYKRPMASTQSAGFTSAKERDGDCLKRIGDTKVWTKHNSKKPIRDPIYAINNKWENMMEDNPIMVPIQPKKAKRTISFSETVTCHAISRIQDLIDEYDAFEDYYESSIHTPSKEIAEESIVNESKTIREINALDMTTTSLSNQSFYNTNDDVELFYDYKRTEWDRDSITSLGPACPTPDRQSSPELMTNQFGGISKTKLNLDHHLNPIANIPYQWYSYKINSVLEEDKDIHNLAKQKQINERKNQDIQQFHQILPNSTITPIVPIRLDDNVKPNLMNYCVGSGTTLTMDPIPKTSKWKFWKTSTDDISEVHRNHSISGFFSRLFSKIFGTDGNGRVNPIS